MGLEGGFWGGEGMMAPGIKYDPGRNEWIFGAGMRKIWTELAAVRSSKICLGFRASGFEVEYVRSCLKMASGKFPS
jgi:hypothetical protein